MPEMIEDVQPLAEFSLHPEKVLMHLKQTQRPIELTVDGKVELVVMDAREFQRLKNLAALVSEEEGIRQGEEDIRLGRVFPAEQVLDEIRQLLDLPR